MNLQLIAGLGCNDEEDLFVVIYPPQFGMVITQLTYV